MASTELSNKMYLLDGSFIEGVSPYVDKDNVMKHPLWGSNMLFENEEAVIKGHKNYIKAGVDFVTTNTYQASVDGFQKYLKLNYEQSIELIKKSVSVCRQAIIEEHSERNVRVMGSVGSFGASLCDGSEYNGNYIDVKSARELYEWHKPRIQALIEAGVDFILFETIPSIDEALILFNILKEFPDQKACLSFSCKDGVYISHGETFASAVEKCWSIDSQNQIVAIGMNCLHPKYITSLLMSVKTKNVNFIAYPNDGGVWDSVKKCWDDTQKHNISIDELKLWSNKGLKIFGGCCETNASNIECFRNLIDHLPF